MGDPSAVPRVLIESELGVAHVQLNRAEKLNALDDDMFVALSEAGQRLSDDPRVRAVVLSGRGRAFCAGLDVSRFSGMVGIDDAGERPALRPGRFTNGAQHVAWVWAELAVPVIAAVRGVAAGAGLQIAMAADLRIVHPDARLGLLEVRWGLSPDGTGTYTLPRLVGVDKAKELAWTGRLVTGREAVTLGLATRLAEDPAAEALALAREIADRSPDAVKATKRLLSVSLDRSPAEQFPDEERIIASLIGRPNQVEAVRAQLESRAPDFTDT
jgi:enoyl-CoA hydratase/carnithine racemase